MFVAALLGLMVAMLLALVRALLGPTVYDRILTANSMGTQTVLLIALLGFLIGRPDFLDLGLAYAFLNFIGTIAVLKFVHKGDLGAGDEPAESMNS